MSSSTIRSKFFGITISTIGLFSGISTAATAELVFSTPPTQSPQTTIKNYQPLVDYLSETIGKKIVIEPAKNFQEYTKNMRDGKYDLVFDGPHFISWRIEKQHNVVIAKQPGELHFAIIVKDNSGVNELRDLWAQPVCSPPVPHLGTLSLLDLYANNPIREPEIVPVQSFKDALQCVRDGKAVAALVRDTFWFKVANKQGLKLIHITSRKLPARGLTVNNRVNKLEQDMIIQALTSKKGQEFSEKAMSTIGGGQFVKANTSEYQDIDELIKIVWGFHE
jgi:ABC-type phosphate/phosphonate transport system substrate-binding protein